MTDDTTKTTGEDKAVAGTGAVFQRLSEMGFISGATLRVVRRSQ